MITLILSILFWISPEEKGLGIAALVFSILGFFVSAYTVGGLAILDLIILIINAVVLSKSNE